MARLSYLSPHWVSLGAWAAAIAIAAGAGAHLIIRFMTPTPVQAVFPTVSDPRKAAQMISARAPVSGATAGDETQVVSIAAPARFTLVGVATGFESSPGFALMQTSGSTQVQAYMAGETLAPGVVLSKLNADSVIIDYNGRTETVPLTRQKSAGGPATATQQRISPPQTRQP